MCGIALITNGQVKIAPSAIERMTDALRHRGPDARATVNTEGCLLGHTRLKIIDPQGGVQPMWDDSQRYCLVFNGEIYNFRELQNELKTSGIRFHTNSDTEVLLLGFRQWGQEVVHKLNGQFAFAVWDSKSKTVFAARDRLGENPLYWAQTSTGELVIASELKSIVASGLLEPEIDRSTVDAYLKLIYVPPNRTIYQNVNTLAPGGQLVYEAGRVRTCPYWQPAISTTSIDEVDATREIRRLLSQSVKRQMVADTDVGAFLSGGLDSTSIVALMTEHSDSHKIKTFSVGFGDLINELPFARDVAQRYRTEHSELQMDIDVGSLLSRMATVYDQPFGDSSNIPTFLVSEFASQHVKVVLSGDGGDELFGGYSWYTPLLEKSSCSDRLNQQILSWAMSRILMGNARRNAKEKYRAIRDRRRPFSVWKQHMAALSVQSTGHRNEMWQKDISPSAEDALLSFQPFREYSEQQNLIDQAVDFDLRCYLPGDIFFKVDQASMANGLETRSPFMDVELVEFVLSLPARLRFSGQSSGTKPYQLSADKHLLRDACSDLWPESISRRNKQGFGAPINNWLQRKDVKEKMEHVMRPNGPLLFLLPGLAHHPVQANNQYQAEWNLLCLGLWLEENEECLNHLKSAS